MTHEDRRSGPDFKQRLLHSCAVLAWILFLLAMLLFHFARPEIQYGLLTFWGISVRTTWALGMSDLFLYTLWGCCLLTLLTVIVNVRRSRRYGDHQVLNLILLLLIVTVSLLSYYIGMF